MQKSSLNSPRVQDFDGDLNKFVYELIESQKNEKIHS